MTRVGRVPFSVTGLFVNNEPKWCALYSNTYVHIVASLSLMSCDCHMQAEEEFNIEKGRLIQNEKRKVATYFERREKQLELQRKM